MDKVAVCLWFEARGEEAAAHYVSLLPDSRITNVLHRDGKVLFVEFTLAGRAFQALNGGPHYKLTPAASISVSCASQAELDTLWEALLDGGAAMACGWLTDRFGVSWQIVPDNLQAMMNDPDPARAARAFAAMQSMIKFDFAALEAAWRGE
ncbi:3-demethylubiquinone-9 3-methyltransferase [alpha proteobacterium AAP81b]|nr:3-demethylubiquinone-9 3-methyltransferase [alpha proteobacterium AAP81b]